MMNQKLTKDQIAEIKACEGVYTASDVARHYGIARFYVGKVWRGENHKDVAPADDFPDIEVQKPFLDEMDVFALYMRGMKASEIAAVLGWGEKTISDIIREKKWNVYTAGGIY